MPHIFETSEQVASSSSDENRRQDAELNHDALPLAPQLPQALPHRDQHNVRSRDEVTRIKFEDIGRGSYRIPGW